VQERIATEEAMFQKYLKWRPLMTADNFWIALLKCVPYEVLTAYVIIRGTYPGVTNMAATGFWFIVLLVLSFAVFYLHRRANSTTASAIALAVCFLLFGLTIDAASFAAWFDSLEKIPANVVRIMIFLMNPFYLLGAAVLVVLASSSLRGILGKSNAG
jgi:hypothetical protein